MPGLDMKTLTIVAGALWALAASGYAGGASAQITSSVTADELETALSEAGLNPSMIVDSSNGAPVANGKAGEISFWVRALDCSGAPIACENLMFFANFNLGRQVTARDYMIINDFNESQVFGRAYIIEGANQVGVDYVIELGGGVARDHLTKNISRWSDVIGSFIEKFRAGQAGS